MVGEELVKSIDVAMGRRAPDLYIKNCRLVNVLSGEIQKEICIGVTGKRISFVGKDLLQPDEHTRVIDGRGLYAMPGFLDGHMHLESSMLTFREFSKEVIKWGTTAVFPDPHEIANVCGMEGVDALVEESKKTPLKSFMLLPSCVPSLEGKETAGAVIDAKQYCQNIFREDYWGMGEMMNYPGVVNKDGDVLEKIDITKKAGKHLTGHVTSEDPHMLNAYASAGIDCCHESNTSEQMLQKLRLGICAMIRESSASKDLKECIKPFVEGNYDTSNVMLVTDDVHADTIQKVGHMNHVINRAIEEGLDPIKAIQMATINTARHFGLAKDIGAIAPGRVADILLAPSVREIVPQMVVVDGELIYTQSNGYLVDFGEHTLPESMKNTVRLYRKLQEEDFDIRVPVRRWSCEMSGGFAEESAGEYSREIADEFEDKSTMIYPVIVVEENSTITRREDLEISISDGKPSMDVQRDIIKVACIERHGGYGNMAVSLIKGFGLKKGAIAQTIAHDSHNILVLGTNHRDMVDAVEAIKKSGGGICLVEDGKILAHHELEIGGLMTTKTLAHTVSSLKNLKASIQKLGCNLESPFMTLSLVALPVIPHLRLTDKGLFDVDRFEFI